MYNVRISAEDIKNLRNIIGSANGELNLTTGVIRVKTIEDVKNIATKFKVENCNNQPYSEIVKETFKNTLDERNEIVGYTLRIGTVVLMKFSAHAEHVVIIDIQDGYYTTARLIFPKKINDIIKMSKNLEIISLEKGKDIIYRNTTYKDIAVVVDIITYNLEKKDFLNNNSPSKMIVGRVTNLRVLEPLINTAKNYNKDRMVQQ